MAASAGPEIERLISLLAKLPGMGPRSARRAALALLKRREQLLVPLAASLAETADKVVNGRYAHDKNFNAFLAAFPISDPQYVVLTFIDEPRTDKGNGAALAGNTAAPMVKEIISRSAAILGVKPKFGEDGSALLVSY